MESQRKRELATEDGKNNLLIYKNGLQQNEKPNSENYQVSIRFIHNSANYYGWLICKLAPVQRATRG